MPANLSWYALYIKPGSMYVIRVHLNRCFEKKISKIEKSKPSNNFKIGAEKIAQWMLKSKIRKIHNKNLSCFCYNFK